jgi:RNA methyltransferase, TrmH family
MREIEPIKSRDNRRLVHVRRIRDGKERALIFIEGRRLAGEALRSKLEIDECFVVDGFRDAELLESVRTRTRSIYEVSEAIFASIADTNQPQGIILIAQRPQTRISEIESRLNLAMLSIVIYLHEINNPSNLGAILRTAEAADIAGVIVSTGSADAFSSKALRAAMGASFRVPIQENAGFDEVLSWATTGRLETTACDISAIEAYSQIDWKKPRLLIFGSEAHGLTSVEIAKVSELIQIPMANNVESLNLAVSAGIIMFEAKRQLS